MIITRKQLVVALISASFLSTGTVSAQQNNNQANAERPQSTNQIVGVAESRPADTASERPRTVTPAAGTPVKAAGPAFELALVIPPAPVVIKRSATDNTMPAANYGAAPSTTLSAIPHTTLSPAQGATSAGGSTSKYRFPPIAIPEDVFPDQKVTTAPAVKMMPRPDANAIAKTDAKPENRLELKYETRPVISTAQLGSSFGYRSDPFTGHAKFHTGYDIKAHWGDSIGASLSGTIQYAGWSHGYGNVVIINHGGGVTTHYAHLSSFDVQVGQHVERGQIIGRAGSTGRATSPHLHYELRIDGSPVHPFQPLAVDPSSDFFRQQAAAIAPSLATAPATTIAPATVNAPASSVPKPPLKLLTIQ